MFRPVLALVAAATLSAPARADTPDPLRCVPPDAQFVIKVENPRKLAEALTSLEASRSAQELAPVRTLLDSTTARRVFQVLAFAEKELGAKWPELLDQLAGGGVAVGGRFQPNAPAVAVLQGTDEKQVAKAYDLMYRVFEEELTRFGGPGVVVRESRDGADYFRLGTDFHYARVGATVLVSNKADALAAAVKLARAPGESVAGKKSIAAAKRLLPKDPLLWAWVDFASVKETKETKDFFESTRADFLQTLVAGSTIDCFKRADFIAAALVKEKSGFRFALRLPAGRDGFPPEFAVHVPPKGTPGSLPLLEPPGVLYSQSFYLDLGFYWKNRDKLVNEQTLKDINTGVEQLNKVLPGSAKFGDLLGMWGPHHRVVVINLETPPYKKAPGQRLPGFAYVAAMRDPQFGKSADAIIRAGALLASLQFGLKSFEETHDGVKIAGWRFPENKPLDADPDGLRFNFEPCFAVVGDQFVAASTFDVCKKVIAEVKRTADKPASPLVWQARGYAAGAADALKLLPDPLVTDAVLSQGVGIEEGRQQVAALAAWVRTLGTARVEIDERAKEYRLDVVWSFGK
jgi:hypothetical protein